MNVLEWRHSHSCAKTIRQSWNILVSFDSGPIYQHVFESFETRWEQVERVEDETNVSFTLLLLYCLVLSRRECKPGIQVCPHLYTNANEAHGTEANLNECQKVVCLTFTCLNIRPALRMYFSLTYWLQTDSVRLFTEGSLHKQILFAAPRLLVYINISLISTCLIRHSRTDVDAV